MLMLPSVLVTLAFNVIVTSVVASVPVSPALSRMLLFARISPVVTSVRMAPFLVESTISPPLHISFCVSVDVGLAAPNASTRLTVRLTLVTVTSPVSVRKVESVVLSVLNLTTFVSRWFVLTPMAAPAVIRRLPAVMSMSL